VTSFVARYQGGPRDGTTEQRPLWPVVFHRVPPRTILVATDTGDVVYRGHGRLTDGTVLYVCEEAA
jgi:hypothetical protein